MKAEHKDVLVDEAERGSSHCGTTQESQEDHDKDRVKNFLALDPGFSVKGFS
jgi:hypothetical protein